MVAQHNIKIICGSVSLAIGAFIYLLFRPIQTLGFKIADSIEVLDLIKDLRQIVAQHKPNDFIIYCLPGAFWVAAYILLIDAVSSKYSIKHRVLVAGFIPFLGIISELMQWANLLPGWFDQMDILCYLVPYILFLLYILTITQINKSKYYEQNRKQQY